MQSPNPLHMANQKASKEGDRRLVSLKRRLQEAIELAAGNATWPVPRKGSERLKSTWHDSLLSHVPSVTGLLQDIFPQANVEYVWTYRLRRFRKGYLKMRVMYRTDEIYRMYFHLPPGMPLSIPDQVPDSSFLSSLDRTHTTQPGFMVTSPFPDITTRRTGRKGYPYSQTNSSQSSQLSQSNLGHSTLSGKTSSALSSLWSKASRALPLGRTFHGVRGAV
jgi:hypothetical protein